MTTFEDFIQKYKPIKNHLNEDRGYNGYAFETFGEELDYICKFNVKQVWTIVSEDNEETYILAGYHYVNRLSYILTEIEWENEDIVVNDNEMISGDKAIEACFNFWETQGFIFDKNQISGYFTKDVYSTGAAKYITRDLYLDLMELDELTEIQDDTLHDYFSRL